jgi:superfamily II DNA or RNA helicase
MFTLRPYQLQLVHDVAKAWRDGYMRPCIVAPCGAGKSIVVADMARRAAENHKQVLYLVHRQELCEQIADTFQTAGVNMDYVQIGMVQTITRRLRKIPKPNLIITDENHHCLANSYRRIYDCFPDVRCVGVTATPVRLNGSGLGDVNDILIMGPTVKELISMGCLAPFDYYAPPVADLSGIHTRAGEFVTEEVEAALSKPHIYGDVIKYYRQLSEGKQAICYCPSIKYSQNMAEQFRAAGITAVHIDGETPKQERADIIARFRSGDIKILCNVDLFSEGFDVPDCNTSILLRPTRSLTLYIQQSMRCMRYKPGKRAVIIDHVGNVHRFGLPDMERKWKLDAKPADRKKEESTVKVKQCPVCFFTHEPAPICPNCGHVYEPERKSPAEVKKAKLEKITEKVLTYVSPDACRNFTELAMYGKSKGYRPGWAYYQAKKRGWLRK